MQSLSVSFLVATELVAPLYGLIVNEDSHRMGFTREVNWPMQQWKHDCGKRVPAYGLLQVELPGAGMSPDKIIPYQTVLKDGFMMVACVKDAMYEHGDKYGDNADQYKMGPIANSSIVHFKDVVPKEDRAPMTPAVCFEFCRGIEDMTFFGISNGRDCYCTPFYRAMASDSSQCDSVCEGDNTVMCGGKVKNSIFSMHTCGTPLEDLEKAKEQAASVEHQMATVCGGMKEVSETVERAAKAMQQSFGRIGDPEASSQMQFANERSGVMLHEAEECLEHATSVGSALQAASELEGQDLTKYDVRKAAEDDIRKLTEVSRTGTKMLKTDMADWRKVQPSLGSAERQANTFLPHVLDQYYSIMYFVDKDYANDGRFPVTCNGDLIGEPALGLDAGHCAAACDELVGKCVGFASYGLSDGEGDAVLCFLFSKFETAQYYTGCESEEGEKSAEFLQQKRRHLSHQDAILGWTTRHRHEVHVNFSASERAVCDQRRRSHTCQEAREKISPNGTATACYLAPNNTWDFGDLPGYFDCLNACCEDYDPNLMLDGLTCSDLMGYYEEPCQEPLEVSSPPPGTTIGTVCPESCKICDEPVTTTTAPATMAAAIPTKQPPVVTTFSLPQPLLKSEIKAMCRAKFSLFGHASLKPDPTGKSKMALKELTKADRCFD